MTDVMKRGGVNNACWKVGLAIVKQACMRLGGSVHLSDEMDRKGCQFVVRIPIVSNNG